MNYLLYTISGFLFALFAASPFHLLPAPSPTPSTAECETAASAVSKLEEKSYESYHNGDIRIYTLMMDGHSELGHSIWLKRGSGKVKAKYFAYKDDYGNDVYDRFSDWQANKDLLLVCSGAYTSDNYTDPTGITVDNGKVVNRNYRDDMDGLVIVYATGGIVASDIENRTIYLKSIDERVDVRNSYQRSKLLKWAKEENATIFQTHLLAYDNELRISEDDRETAERRLLVLAKDGDDIVHIIFNIEEDVFLYDISKYLFDYLQDKDVNIIAMLNLDTGWGNVLQVYDNDGDKLHDIQGDKNLSRATNLIVYHYE